ncbi:MAG: hypothetical protein KA250_18135 [Verrucomicrobiales bacterium]|nr:hypothetical protein [Verrucomicrobiales bacterium]
MGEKRPVNHTPTIALSIAAILLLIVGALSYKDFLKERYDKEYAEKEARWMQMHGYPATAMQGQPGSVLPGQAANDASLQPGLAQPQAVAQTPAPVPPSPSLPPEGVVYDAQGNAIVLAQPNPGVAYESSLPVPVDPELNKIRSSLDQAREQGRRTEERYNQLAGNVDTLAKEAEKSTSTEITAELPDFLRDALQNPPGGNPEVEAKLQKMKAQVTAQPSLAKVTSYDKDWGIVTFNAGQGQGVKVDQRFAVRRGSEILGWVKVDQVDGNQSIAVLITKNRESDTAAKPEIGDDLIDFELF